VVWLRVRRIILQDMPIRLRFRLSGVDLHKIRLEPSISKSDPIEVSSRYYAMIFMHSCYHRNQVSSTIVYRNIANDKIY
jgi:hypothetical protein